MFYTILISNLTEKLFYFALLLTIILGTLWLTKKDQRVKRWLKILTATSGLLLMITVTLPPADEKIREYVCIRKGGSFAKIVDETASTEGYRKCIHERDPLIDQVAVHLYPDGGKPCKSSGECVGNCIVVDPTRWDEGGWIEGVCEYDSDSRSDIGGCFYPTIEDGRGRRPEYGISCP